MNEKSIVSLYVVQENDTIESICEKFKIDKETLFRYNPLLKTKLLHQGKPLTIVTKNEIIAERKVSKKVPNEGEFNKILRDIAYYLKEGIASNAFYETNLEPVVNELETLYSSLADLFVKFSDPKKKEQLIAFLKDIEQQYFKIIPLLKKKDPELIKKYENNLEITTNELVSFLEGVEESLVDKNLINVVHRIIDLFNLLALKFLTLKFSSAQRIFKEILKQIEQLVSMIDIKYKTTKQKED